MNKIRQIISNIDHDFMEILRHSFYAFLMIAIAGIAQFLFDLILAHKFGASGYGMFYLTFYVILMLSLLGRLGINQAVVKYIPRFVHQRKWGELMGLRKTADFTTLTISVSIAATSLLLTPWIANSIFHKPEAAIYLRWLLLIIPALSFLYVQTGFLSGLKLIKESVFIERAGVNTIAILIMLSFGYLFGVNSAVIGTVIGVLLFAFLGSVAVKRKIPKGYTTIPFKRSSLLLLAIPLFMVDFSNQMVGQINAIILGGHGSSAEVGVFNAALRLSGLISIILTGINAIATTKIAELHHKGQTKKLEFLASKTAALAVFCGLPIIFCFILWPQYFLGFFGKDFVAGCQALRLLVIGQSFNLLTGSVVQMLSMTGYHKQAGYGVFGAGFLLNTLLAAILIPIFGITGAALAVCISLILQNVLLLFMTKYYVKIWSLPFAALYTWLKSAATS